MSVVGATAVATGSVVAADALVVEAASAVGATLVVELVDSVEAAGEVEFEESPSLPAHAATDRSTARADAILIADVFGTRCRDFTK